MSFSLEIDKNSAYLLTDKYERRYFSGIDNAEGLVVITSSQTAYFADSRYYYALKQKLLNTQVRPFLYKSLESIKSFLSENHIKTLYVDYNATTLSQYNTYKTLGVKIANGTESLSNCRKEKTQTEIESIEKACKIASSAFEYILPFIKEGVTEKSIKNRSKKEKEKMNKQIEDRDQASRQHANNNVRG